MITFLNNVVVVRREAALVTLLHADIDDVRDITCRQCIGNIACIGYIPGMAQKNVEFPVRKVILMTEEMAARISEIRHINRIASENETIRQMLEFGLAAAERKAAAKAKPE